jgi:tripartite ATP-independent transporter DctP family solute receptor
MGVMMLKKIWKQAVSGLAVLSLLLTVIGCGAGQSKKPTAQPASMASATTTDVKDREIKLAIVLQENHPQGLGGKKFKELIEKNSNGKIKVSAYYNGVLGDDKKAVESLRGGTIELTVVPTSILSGTVKEFGVLDLPFIFNNEQEADIVLDGAVGKALIDKLPTHDLVGLGYWENGFRNITNSKRPVTTLEDFKGLKIRTLQNAVHIEVFKALGTNPVPMAFTELYTALDTHTIDGEENPLKTIETSKFYEVQSQLSLSRHLYTPFIFLAGKKFWDQLSDDEKKMLQDAAIEAGKYQRELNREENKKSLENLKAKGMKVSEISEAEMNKIKAAVKPVIDNHAKSLGEDLVKQMFDELQKIRTQK